MGCFSSNLSKQRLNQEFLFKNHVVSLASTSYGLLKIDPEPIDNHFKHSTTSPPPLHSYSKEPTEVINAWEMMKDVEDEIPLSIKSPRPDPDWLLLEQNSPRKQRKFAGKENRQRQVNGERTEGSPVNALKPLSSLKVESFRFDVEVAAAEECLSPLFDPELVAFYERELDEEEGEIKNIITTIIPRVREAECLDSFVEKKSPPGGDNAVIIYTTTLRGIRKTFEDCNVVRSVIESYNVHMIERDISMDSGFREELRLLMGVKEVRVPVVFVKGRLIGGADEVVKMEEEGKLALLFEGIPRALVGCDGCAGMRFVMCLECSGSCKVLDEEEREMVKCEECNENGLIQCPICC